jgi:hypothetical protein
MAHRSKKLQFEVVAVLGLLALFTHMHIFWVIGLLLALIDLPDFTGPMRRIAGSAERIAGLPPGTGDAVDDSPMAHGAAQATPPTAALLASLGSAPARRLSHPEVAAFIAAEGVRWGEAARAADARLDTHAEQLGVGCRAGCEPAPMRRKPAADRDCGTPLLTRGKACEVLSTGRAGN